MDPLTNSIILSTAYLAPVSWYVCLARSSRAVIDGGEHYVKQTWRNRCRILMPDGPQDLVIPLEQASSHAPIRDIRISEHGQWRHHHWNALRTAYGKSPFFEYYADDFAPFYEQRHEYLLDYNEGLRQLVCSLLDIDNPVTVSGDYVEAAASGAADYRSFITPKCPTDVVPGMSLRPYYQVFSHRQSFQSNLSIVDLLFNMGPEGLLWLQSPSLE